MQVTSIVLWLNHFTVLFEGTMEVGGSHYSPGPFNKVITPRMLELSLRSSYGSKIITINSIMITSTHSLQLPITTGAGLVTSLFYVF